MFNKFKEFVLKTANSETGMIDISYLQSVYKMTKFKIKLFNTYEKYDIKSPYKSVEQVLYNDRAEIYASRPAEIAFKLIDQTQVLSNTDEKLKKVAD